MQREFEFQRDYFTGPGRTKRIEPGVTPCVQRHFATTMSELRLRPGDRVLELGCGLGRFTRLLLDAGLHVTALDLSPHLIEQLRTQLSNASSLDTMACPAEQLDDFVPGPFDAAVGFFFLHHLKDFSPVIRAVSSVLAPGGRIAFCEPNAFNPLVYLQVTFTPGMSWKGEPGIPRMHPGAVYPVLRQHGFQDLASTLYGALPPFVANTRIGGKIEHACERVRLLDPVLAYRLFTGRLAPHKPGSLATNDSKAR